MATKPKLDLAGGMNKIATREKTSTKGAIIPEAPKAKERKVVSIYLEDYEVLRTYAYENRCSISEAIAAAVKSL